MMTEVLTAEARLSQATILLSPAPIKALVISSTAEPVIIAGPGCQATDTGTGAESTSRNQRSASRGILTSIPRVRAATTGTTSLATIPSWVADSATRRATGPSAAGTA